MKLNALWSLVLTLLSLSLLNAQQIGRCGVGIEDGMKIIEGLEENKKFLAETAFPRADKLYVPLIFNLVSKNEGEGRLDESTIFAQICRLNADYLDADMVFYVKEINYLISNGLYTNPTSSASFNTMINNKGAGVNIFVCERAQHPDEDGQGGTTLGYYSPSGDYIVCRKEEIVSANGTLTHEIGHFFDMPHTFFGWECQTVDGYTYDPAVHGNPLTITNAPCSGGGFNIPVELMDGSNCSTAADRICDTPPGYNFPFSNGFGGPCGTSQDCFDKNGDLVIPMANNVMGYFDGCSSFEFTPDQISLMRADFLSPGRAYIRSSYEPNEALVDPNVAMTGFSPADFETAENYNGVLISWNEVAGADTYFLRITDGAETFQYYTDKTEHYETNLSPGKQYFWFIIPHNETSMCHEGSGVLRFITGSGTTSTKDLISGIDAIALFPNPASIGESVNLYVEAKQIKDIKISLLTINGQTLNVKAQHQITTGENTITIPTSNISSGVYFLRISSDNETTLRKLIIE